MTGSLTGTIPVSISTVATQMVLLPDMGGYSTCSMMMKPAAGWGPSVAVRGCSLPPGTRVARAASAGEGRRDTWRGGASCRTSWPRARLRPPPMMTLPGSPAAWASTATTSSCGLGQPGRGRVAGAGVREPAV